MALPDDKSALIPQGWVRALFLLVVYISLSVFVAKYFQSPASWITVVFILTLVVVYIFRTVIDRKSFASLGLDLTRIFPDALTGLLGGSLLLIVGALIIYALNGLRWIDITVDIRNIVLNMVLIMMVSVSEELVFRGYFLQNLSRSINKWAALLVSAILFMVLHLPNDLISVVGMVNVFLGGLFLGITFLHTRSLWLPIFFHFSWNFLQGPILGFPVSGLNFETMLVVELRGSALLTGGEFGFEGSLICTFLLSPAIVAVAFLHNRQVSKTRY